MFTLLSPGDWLANMVGLDGDNRQIFRMFINTLTFSALGVAILLYII